MRYIARTDSNHKKIMLELRQCGFSVVSLHQSGKGVPDLLIGKNGVMHLIEIKTVKGALTPDQEKFITEWRGSPVIVATSLEEILAKIS